MMILFLLSGAEGVQASSLSLGTELSDRATLKSQIASQVEALSFYNDTGQWFLNVVDTVKTLKALGRVLGEKFEDVQDPLEGVSSFAFYEDNAYPVLKKATNCLREIKDIALDTQMTEALQNLLRKIMSCIEEVKREAAQCDEKLQGYRTIIDQIIKEKDVRTLEAELTEKERNIVQALLEHLYLDFPSVDAFKAEIMSWSVRKHALPDQKKMPNGQPLIVTCQKINADKEKWYARLEKNKNNLGALLSLEEMFRSSISSSDRDIRSFKTAFDKYKGAIEEKEKSEPGR